MIKRSVSYVAALAVILTGSFAVPSQAGVKMVAAGGASCGSQGNTCSNNGSSCGGQINLNDLFSGDLGCIGGGCNASWSSPSLSWCLPGGLCIGGSCGDASCPTDYFWDRNCNVGNSGNGSCSTGGSWCWPDITIPDENVPGADLPGQWQPDGDHRYPSYDQGQDVSGYLQQVVSLVNQERSKAGLPALKESTQLSAAAAVRAQEIAVSFAHVRPNGSSFSTAISQNGISFNGAGENIAYGQTTPAEVMNAWMNSQTHREAILNSRYTNIGVACYQDSNGVLYWTQLFTY